MKRNKQYKRNENQHYNTLNQFTNSVLLYLKYLKSVVLTPYELLTHLPKYQFFIQNQLHLGYIPSV